MRMLRDRICSIWSRRRWHPCTYYWHPCTYYIWLVTIVAWLNLATNPQSRNSSGVPLRQARTHAQRHSSVEINLLRSEKNLQLEQHLSNLLSHFSIRVNYSLIPKPCLLGDFDTLILKLQTRAAKSFSQSWTVLHASGFSVISSTQWKHCLWLCALHIPRCSRLGN